MTYDNFTHYLIGLFVLTGLLILRFDVKTYAMADMKKERKVSRVLGWINLILGIAVFIVDFAFNRFWWS